MPATIAGLRLLIFPSIAPNLPRRASQYPLMLRDATGEPDAADATGEPTNPMSAMHLSGVTFAPAMPFLGVEAGIRQ